MSGYRGDATTARAALDDPAPKLRCSALSALARLDELRPTDLAAALADRDATVRRHAATITSRLGWSTDRRPSLVAALRDPDQRVVEAAAFAVGEQTVHHEGELDALVAVATDHDDHLCREAAVAALGSIGDPAGLDAVLRGTTDRATVRRRAVLALVAFDDPAVEEALDRLRSDRDLQVRQAAEDLLAISDGSEVARDDG